MADDRQEWADQLIEASKLAGIWEAGLSVAKLAKRIEEAIGKAYGDRQITRWLKADEAYKAPTSDVRKQVLGRLTPMVTVVRVEAESDPRPFTGEPLRYPDSLAKNDALWHAIEAAQRQSENMAEQMARLREIFTAPVGDVDADAVAEAADPQVPAPGTKRRRRAS
jgi:hypothetical protein